MKPLFDALPADATGAALRGHFDVGGDHGWFLLDYFLEPDFSEVVAAANKVFSWLDANAAGFKSVSLAGFSQGMAMASTLLRLRPRDFRTVAGLSGFILNSPLLEMTDDAFTRTPFFWGRDVEDLVIHEDAVAYSAAWLEEHTQLTARTYPGMGHTIGAAEVRDLGVYWRAYLR
jgi:phospholipase/carboxylesterase